MKKILLFTILISLLTGCANIPLFFEFDLQNIEKKLIDNNQLERRNLNITNCITAFTTLDENKYNISIPFLDDPKLAIFYHGVCAIDIRTKIIYFEPTESSAEYYKKYGQPVTKIYPYWYTSYGYKDSPNITMSKFPSGQLHLIGKYLYVLDMTRSKITEYEEIIKSEDVKKVELRRFVSPWCDMCISVDNVKRR